MADDEWGAAVAPTQQFENLAVNKSSAPKPSAGRGMGRGNTTLNSPQRPGPSGDSDDSGKELTAGDTSLLNKICIRNLSPLRLTLKFNTRIPNLRYIQKPELLKGIYGMGFSFPSKIQESALPALLADPPTNMIAQSQSGTVARGEKVREQIVVGTPGTLLDWCIKFKAIAMSAIKVFVLDEADVMISQQGHQDQSIRLQRALSQDCQLLLFSATYDQTVMMFAQAMIKDAITIRLRKEEESLDNIKQYYISCGSDVEKFDAITNIYGAITIGQSMIFCRTRRTASWLASEMTRQGHAVALLSGELETAQRHDVIERFRDGKEKVLITTNVSARGLDIEQVTVVINYDLPTDQTNQEPDYETYLHRIGRTGRFGKNGLAINFVDGRRSMEILQKIQQHFNKQILKLDATDFEEIEKIGS
ncbi:DDX19B [Bugula neritina]|uniref:RNA helicase n=1 Tax=Bugula neritina TaxID=10212 RepID=A0A7J7K3L0_BUGNE|nr:DDX19B [Bugula neritina]